LKRTGVDETSYQQRWSASFDVIADISNAGLLHISWKRLNQPTFVITCFFKDWFAAVAHQRLLPDKCQVVLLTAI
jgi:hypothetical protein